MHMRYLLFWLPMIPIAFANGTLRQLVFVKLVNELFAHQLSTITLMILSTVYVVLVFPKLGVKHTSQAITVGLLWLILTVAFEFMLGRLTHRSWHSLLYDYNLLAGRIWLLFLLWLFALPYVVYILRK